MFSKIGWQEIALILVVVLLIFGPSKLPELGKSLAKGIRGFKESMSEDAPAEPAKEEPGDGKAGQAPKKQPPA